ELEAYGVAKIFSPEDGMRLGLQGMIDHMLRETDFRTVAELDGEVKELIEEREASCEPRAMARLLTAVEQEMVEEIPAPAFAGMGGDGAAEVHTEAPVLGITGTGGAGKST